MAILGILASWLIHQCKTVQPKYKANDEGNSSPDQISIIPKLVPAPPATKKCDSCRYPGTPWWKTVAELIGIGAVVWYAYTSHNQWQVMQRQLEATERPWIDPVITPDGSIKYTTMGETQFSFSVAMRNIGHSVATGVTIKFKIIVPKQDGYFTEPIEEQRELCGIPPKSKVKDSEVRVIFPESTSVEGIGDNISDSTIREHQTKIPIEGVYFAPELVGCVDYNFSTALAHHQTGFIYDIRRIEPAHPSAPFVLELGKDLTQDRIRLDRYMFGGDYAY